MYFDRNENIILTENENFVESKQNPSDCSRRKSTMYVVQQKFVRYME